MNRLFSGRLEELQFALSSLGGTWTQKGPDRWMFSIDDNRMIFDCLNGEVEFFPSSGDDENNKLFMEIMQSTIDELEKAPDLIQSMRQSLMGDFSESEIVIGLVGAVGSRLDRVQDEIQERLMAAGYSVERIKISKEVIPIIVEVPNSFANEYERISCLMDAGNSARKVSGNTSILALGVASFINYLRGSRLGGRAARSKTAYIINSLKRPEEVAQLRTIYGVGFYLFGVHCEKDRRLKYLTEGRSIPGNLANSLIDRDHTEKDRFGQQTAKTFHLSDFFVRIDGNDDQLKNCIYRLVDLMLGHPYITPSFGEHAMYLAFTSALRSADLSRQVGAVIARDREVLSTGANECPTFGGGLYWPLYDHAAKKYADQNRGRDFERANDSNRSQQIEMINGIVKAIEDEFDSAMPPEDNELKRDEVKAKLVDLCEAVLKRSSITDLTEFGRVVHAEMEALLSCARNNHSPRGATLYCTTFPCHNCAKHIVASGIVRVVYIEPYPKSKASVFHDDSIHIGFRQEEDDPINRKRVYFEPFVGVGPRRFFDLFSMSLGSGYALERKNSDGKTIDWFIGNGRLRVPMLPYSYLDLEFAACVFFDKLRTQPKDEPCNSTTT